MKLFKNRKGAATGLVIMLITVVIVLVIGLVIVGQLNATASVMDLGVEGNETRTALFSNVYSAFNLAVLIPIVAVAGTILGIIFLYLGRGKT